MSTYINLKYVGYFSTKMSPLDDCLVKIYQITLLSSGSLLPDLIGSLIRL